MTIDRPYQKGMLLPEALERIKTFVGTRYDASVVNALIRGCDAGEIGQGVVRFLVNAKNAEAEKEAQEELDPRHPKSRLTNPPPQRGTFTL